MDVFADIFDRIRTALTGGDGRALTENQKKVYQDLAGRFDVMMKYYQDAVANVRESEGMANSDARYAVRAVGDKKVAWVENNTLTNAQLNDFSAVANYIAEHIGEMYSIIESGQPVYIGEDLPDEYTHSKYTSYLQKNNKSLLRAKNKATGVLGDMIEIATNRRWERTNHPNSKDAKYGMYRYDSSFAFPVKDPAGKFQRARAYDVELLIRNASDGKKYLYDIVNIKENTPVTISLTNSEARSAAKKEAATRGSASKESISDTVEKSNPKISEATKTADRAVGIQVDEGTESVSPTAKLSLRSYRESDYVQDRETAAKDLSDRLGITVGKAKRYIDSVNSVAKMIADDRVRLDYESSPGRSSFVGNTEYGGSIDFSTVCKKRRLYTGTIDAIQRGFEPRRSPPLCGCFAAIRCASLRSKNAAHFGVRGSNRRKTE